MQGPGRWAPRASGGLRVKRLVGQAPQVGDPRRACQRGGLPCVTPSPQGDPFAWGTCESGGSPPDPPSSAHGETWGWGTAAPRVLPEPRFPSRDSSCSALSPISGRGVFWGRPPWSWPLFLVPSCVGWGSGRPRKACLPCLPPVQHVSTLQPPGCPAVTGWAALAQPPRLSGTTQDLGTTRPRVLSRQRQTLGDQHLESAPVMRASEATISESLC